MQYLAYVVATAIFLPGVAAAQTGGSEFGEISNFLGNIISFLNGTIVPLVFAIAFLVFIWGIFTFFIRGGDDEEKRKKGQMFMLWGIIGFVVMVSVWGIVNLLAEGLNLTESGSQVDIPNLPGRSNN
jgi:hypothetical protein